MPLKNRGRTTCWIVNVFADISGIDLHWVGLQSLVQVERIGIREGKPYQQRVRPQSDITREPQGSHID